MGVRTHTDVTCHTSGPYVEPGRITASQIAGFYLEKWVRMQEGAIKGSVVLVNTWFRI